MHLLIIAAGVIASLQFGYHIVGPVSWRTWHGPRRSSLLSALLFPINSYEDTVGKGLGLMVDDVEESTYRKVMAVVWPLKLLSSVFCGGVVAAIMVTKYALKAGGFLILELPERAGRRWLGRPPVRVHAALPAPPATAELREAEAQIDRDLDLDAKFRALEAAQKEKDQSR